jgi:hypothetical protein
MVLIIGWLSYQKGRFGRSGFPSVMRRRLDRATAGGRTIKGSKISVTVATQIAIPYAAATANVIATSFARRLRERCRDPKLM